MNNRQERLESLKEDKNKIDNKTLCELFLAKIDIMLALPKNKKFIKKIIEEQDKKNSH